MINNSAHYERIKEEERAIKNITLLLNKRIARHNDYVSMSENCLDNKSITKFKLSLYQYSQKRELVEDEVTIVKDKAIRII